MPTAAILTALLALLALTTEFAVGANFRPITDAERAYSQVPFAPDAGAVVFFSRGELRLMDYPVEVSSSFDVEVRI